MASYFIQSKNTNPYKDPQDQSGLVFHYFTDLVCHSLSLKQSYSCYYLHALQQMLQAYTQLHTLLLFLLLGILHCTYQMVTLLTCSRLLLKYHFLKDTLLRHALINLFKITTTLSPRTHKSILFCFKKKKVFLQHLIMY